MKPAIASLHEFLQNWPNEVHALQSKRLISWAELVLALNFHDNINELFENFKNTSELLNKNPDDAPKTLD